MIHDCVIKSKSAAQIVVNNPTIGDVTIGVHKHTLLFLSLRSKQLNDSISIDIEEYNGRYYCTSSIKTEESLDRAERILFEREKRAHARKMWENSPF
jgi:hypothetical protein